MMIEARSFELLSLQAAKHPTFKNIKHVTRNSERGIKVIPIQGRCLVYESCRMEVLEVIRLCNLSKMPEKIGKFIEQDVNAKQAQEILMSILAERTKKTEILSTIPQSLSEDLMPAYNQVFKTF